MSVKNEKLSMWSSWISWNKLSSESSWGLSIWNWPWGQIQNSFLKFFDMKNSKMCLACLIITLESHPTGTDFMVRSKVNFWRHFGIKNSKVHLGCFMLALEDYPSGTDLEVRSKIHFWSFLTSKIQKCVLSVCWLHLSPCKLELNLWSDPKQIFDVILVSKTQTYTSYFFVDPWSLVIWNWPWGQTQNLFLKFCWYQKFTKTFSCLEIEVTFKSCLLKKKSWPRG